jgi:hypothetical protein
MTVPRSVLDAAERLAQELGTTRNAALVRLAEEGAAARERRTRIGALAVEHRVAVERVDLSGAVGFPSPAEFHEAMLAGRHGC